MIFPSIATLEWVGRRRALGPGQRMLPCNNVGTMWGRWLGRWINSQNGADRAARSADLQIRANHPGKILEKFRDRPTCGKASPAAAVILHLHSCYVSKAAILTVLALPVPVENRSPA